jgi:hypothetical protein
MNILACYFDTPPDLGPLEDVDRLRTHLGRAFETPGPVARTPKVSGLGPRRSAPAPPVLDECRLLDVEVRSVASVRSVIAVVRMREAARTSFQSTVFIPFARCFWTLQVGLFGVDSSLRERMVEDLVLNHPSVDPFDVTSFDPDHHYWDGIAPIERDPVAQLRQLTRALEHSVRLGPEVAGLEPFGRSTT